MLCRWCTSYWYYIIGTSPPFARSKLRFLSFRDQNPWKDVKSSIVFFWICIHGWLNFSSKIEKNKRDRDFHSFLHHFLDSYENLMKMMNQKKRRQANQGKKNWKKQASEKESTDCKILACFLYYCSVCVKLVCFSCSLPCLVSVL